MKRKARELKAKQKPGAKIDNKIGCSSDRYKKFRIAKQGLRRANRMSILREIRFQFSFLSQDPSWKPFKEFATTGRKFGMAELIKQVMKA
jgi:hypothetical protein